MLIGGIHASLKKFIESSLVGFFYSFFVPGGQVVGETMKAVRILGNEEKKKEIVFSIFVARITGFIALGILCAVTFFLNDVLWGDRISIFTLMLGMGIALLCGFLLFAPYGAALIRFLSRRGSFMKTYVGEAYDLYVAHPRELLIATSLSWIIHGAAAFSIFLIAIGIGVVLPFSYFLWLYLVTGIVLFMPIAYAGFGPREWTFVYFLGLQQISFETAIAISFLFAAVNMGIAVIGLGYEIRNLIR